MAKDLRIGTVLDGLYRLDRLLGEGGVGSVYAATHIHLGQARAVKILKTPYAKVGEPLARFQREAKFLSKHPHDNIVQIYDFGEAEDGTVYMAMELVSGQTLHQRVLEGPLSVPEVLSMFRQLCEALGQAHGLGILHRDLKPDNLMLAPGGALKILDFGMAKLVSSTQELTQANIVMGTPNYLAPERARGHRALDPTSDVFSLGALLYESLMAKMAFAGQDAYTTMVRVLQNPVPPLELDDTAMAERLDEVIAIACAKDPRDRYQTAPAMYLALHAAVHAAKPTTTEESETRIKAGLIQSTLGYIGERFGEEGTRKVGTLLGAERMQVIRRALPNTWLMAADLFALHEAMLELFDDGSLDLMRDVGRAFAEIGLTQGPYKSFLNAAGPSTLIQRTQVMYRAGADGGEMQAVPAGEGRWLLRLRKVAGLTMALMAATSGWTRRYLELAGARNIVIHEERIRYEEGAPVGEILLSFSAAEE